MFQFSSSYTSYNQGGIPELSRFVNMSRPIMILAAGSAGRTRRFYCKQESSKPDTPVTLTGFRSLKKCLCKFEVSLYSPSSSCLVQFGHIDPVDFSIIVFRSMSSIF